MKSLDVLFIFVFLTILFPFQNPASAQIPPIDLATAAQYFREANGLCRRDDGKLWGVSLCAPVLLVDPQTRAVVANFADKESVLTKNGSVFTGRLPAQVNVANTAVEWAGMKWTMMMLPLPEDKIRRAGLMGHEMWHRVQSDIGFPASGAANDHLDSSDGRVWLQLEWRALAKALSVRGEQRRRAIADALLFRAYRRTIFPNAAAQEREMEMHEGLAEYTGVQLAGSPNLNRHLIDANLKEAPQKQTFVRSFAYASAPAYGVLLDETKADWRKNLKKDDDLGNLLRAGLSVELPQSPKQAAESRAKDYDGEQLLASEADRENNRRKLLAEYRSRLVEGAVLMIPLQKMNMQFNPGNLLPLEALGTVYPDIRIVDVWGILTVSKGGALVNPTFSKIYVPAPTDLTRSPFQGDGWTLELNAGWTMTNGERKGDYVVKKSE
ncbi:MAG TPA: hypothetical protein VK308_14930 [Pyrinomonadaceae bacterium]|nr:hypothetical protein [Pyrinomonadaceae bacterium]